MKPKSREDFPVRKSALKLLLNYINVDLMEMYTERLGKLQGKYIFYAQTEITVSIGFCISCLIHISFLCIYFVCPV